MNIVLCLYIDSDADDDSSTSNDDSEESGTVMVSENYNDCSALFGLSQSTRVTDGRTDGQTDRITSRKTALA